MDIDTKEYEQIIDDLIRPYCKELQSEMMAIRQGLSHEMSIPELQNHLLKLSNILYFSSAGQEIAGLKADISKENKINKISQVILDSQGSQAEKRANAELLADNEKLVNSIYDRAYRKLKLKIDLGLEMLNSLKKVLSSRMLEMELSK